MRILARFGIKVVAEADGVGEPVDRRILAGEEMPTIGRSRPVVAREICLLFRRREIGPSVWIETDGQHFEIFSGVERHVDHRSAQDR